jgi:hypothetical protein
MAFLAGIKGTLFAEDTPAIPKVFALSQNFPNPFNPSTTVEFALPHAAAVTVDVFNLLGEKVATLVSGVLPAGRHRTTWDASVAGSGVYFTRLLAGDYSETRRMLLLK